MPIFFYFTSLLARKLFIMALLTESITSLTDSGRKVSVTEVQSSSSVTDFVICIQWIIAKNPA